MSATIKKDIIMGFSLLPDIEGLNGNDLILATPMGLICGTPATFPQGEENPDDRQNVNGLYEQILSHIRSKHEGEIVGNDGYIVLDNVSIRSTGNQIINVGTMVIFYDQIIGVSLGKLNG